jgi:transcriptional regulator with XRE-family HTH domain
MPSKKRRIDHDAIVRGFAARLRDRRTAAGLTQTGLARKAHVTLTYVNRLEAGAAAPGIDTVARLAAALGTTTHDLLPEPAPAEELATHATAARAALDAILRVGDSDLIRSVRTVLDEVVRARMQSG